MARQAGFALRLLALLLIALPARAHDVPGSIALHAFVRIEDGQVALLARVPLVLFGNLDLPLRGPGYLDLERIAPTLDEAGALVGRALRLADREAPLPQRLLRARISLPSDRAFENSATARTLIRGPPLAIGENIIATQGFFDAEFVSPLPASLDRLTLRLALPANLGDRLRLGLRLELPDGTVRPFEIRGAEASIRLLPDAIYAARRFVVEGTLHILGGVDHLLFLLCLIVPLRRDPWRMLAVITAFTVGHSATLAAAALGMAPSGAWFPPLVEALIAASIVWTAVENAVGRYAIARPTLAAGFGLVHGFAFAGALADGLQFAGSHLVLALAAFNIGIEIGQVAALIVAVPLLNLVLRSPVAVRIVPLIIAILAGHAAWHWLEQRLAALPTEELIADLAATEPIRAAAWAATALAVVLIARGLGSVVRGPRALRRE
jgi:hypothetical protein